MAKRKGCRKRGKKNTSKKINPKNDFDLLRGRSSSSGEPFWQHVVKIIIIVSFWIFVVWLISKSGAPIIEAIKLGGMGMLNYLSKQPP